MVVVFGSRDGWPVFWWCNYTSNYRVIIHREPDRERLTLSKTRRWRHYSTDKMRRLTGSKTVHDWCVDEWRTSILYIPAATLSLLSRESYGNKLPTKRLFGKRFIIDNNVIGPLFADSTLPVEKLVYCSGGPTEFISVLTRVRLPAIFYCSMLSVLWLDFLFSQVLIYFSLLYTGDISHCTPACWCGH